MLLAALAGALLAWFGYRGRLTEPLARWAAVARFIGIAALLLLLIDPGFTGRGFGVRPLVLLDRSVSMSAAGGRQAEAAALAASLGDTVAFGMLAPRLPGGSSRLADLVSSSTTSGRSITVVTDGEIPDVSVIPADLLARLNVRVLPRPALVDLALTGVKAEERLTVGDTLTVAVDATRGTTAPDSAAIEVRDGSRVLMRGVVQFHGQRQGRVVLSASLPAAITGERWLDVAIAGPPDGEPADDIRWLHLMVTPTPGIVVISTAPDWDGRALFRTLRDVASAPVAGFAQLQPGHWYRMSDLHAATAADVGAAARAADLVAVRGDIAAWRTSGRSRLLWPASSEEGDWFLVGEPASPVGSAFAGVDADSLSPGVSAAPLTVDPKHDWIGLRARRSRRGADLPVVMGTEGGTGRSVWYSVDGLYRWAGRGGQSAQVWRGLVSSTVNWLLASSARDSARARPVDAVTQRGRAVRFRWIGSGPPMIEGIRLQSATGDIVDSLRFDGAGDAMLALDVGRYRYALDHGGAGSVAVEPYADEMVPAAVTLAERTAQVPPTSPKRSWRELWWLFAISIMGFGIEWLVRRRLGAR